MRIISKIALFVASVAVLSSCGQQEGSPVHSDVGPTSEPVVHGSMTASLNGEDWAAGGTPTEIHVDDASASVDPNTGMVTITGRKYTYHSLKADNLEEIAITLKQMVPGVYALAPDFNNFQTATFTRGLTNPSTYFIQERQSGTASIIRIDSSEHRIFGTFTFSAKNQKGELLTVTNGTFDNVKYEPPVMAATNPGQ